MAASVTLFVAGMLIIAMFIGPTDPNQKSLANSFVKDTTLEVIVCDRFKTIEKDSGETVYSIVFAAINGEEIINDGDLTVSKVTYAKAKPSQKGKLTLDGAGQCKRYQPSGVFVGVS